MSDLLKDELDERTESGSRHRDVEVIQLLLMKQKHPNLATG